MTNEQVILILEKLVEQLKKNAPLSTGVEEDSQEIKKRSEVIPTKRGYLNSLQMEKMFHMKMNNIYNHITRGRLPKPVRFGKYSFWNKKEVREAKKLLNKKI